MKAHTVRGSSAEFLRIFLPQRLVFTVHSRKGLEVYVLELDEDSVTENVLKVIGGPIRFLHTECRVMESNLAQWLILLWTACVFDISLTLYQRVKW